MYAYLENSKAAKMHRIHVIERQEKQRWRKEDDKKFRNGR